MKRGWSHSDLGGGILFAAVGVFVWFYSATFPELPDGHPGPALFPGIIAAGLVLTGLALAVLSFRELRQQPLTKLRLHIRPRQLVRPLAIIALVAVYPWARELILFIPAVAAISLAVALLLKARLIPAMIVSVVAAIVMQLLFTGLLGVPL